FFFFSSRRRHTRSVSAFLLNRSSDLCKLLMLICILTKNVITSCSVTMRLFLLVLILLLMPTLNFLPVWFALSLLRFRLPSRLPRSEERRVGKECIFRWSRYHYNTS